MNLSPRWVDDLKAAGIESQHWSAIGRPDATDAEILEYAVRQSLILLTLHLDSARSQPAPGAGPMRN
jgi:predicted nuclease of predicted toxin-antitoxin system